MSDPIDKTVVDLKLLQLHQIEVAQKDMQSAIEKMQHDIDTIHDELQRVATTSSRSSLKLEIAARERKTIIANLSDVAAKLDQTLKNVGLGDVTCRRPVK